MPAISTKKWTALLVLTALLFGLLAFLPRDWTTLSGEDSKGRDYDTISVINPSLIDTIVYGSVCLAILLLIIAIVSKKNHSIPHKALFWIMPLVVYPASCTKGTISNIAPWTYHGIVKDSDGTRYYFLDSSFLQGQTMALAKMTEHGLFVDRFKVLVTNNGDSPRSYATIVRPADAKDTYGQLYLTRSRMLLGVRDLNECYLAYNLTMGVRYGHGAVEKLSPFIGIDAQTPLHQGDVQAMKEEGLGGSPGKPFAESIKSDLGHPNPEVRRIAKELLERQQGTPATP